MNALVSISTLHCVRSPFCAGNGVAKGVPEQQLHSSSEQYRIDTTLMGRVMYRFVRNIKEEVKRLMKWSTVCTNVVTFIVTVCECSVCSNPCLCVLALLTLPVYVCLCTCFSSQQLFYFCLSQAIVPIDAVDVWCLWAYLLFDREFATFLMNLKKCAWQTGIIQYVILWRLIATLW